MIIRSILHYKVYQRVYKKTNIKYTMILFMTQTNLNLNPFQRPLSYPDSLPWYGGDEDHIVGSAVGGRSNGGGAKRIGTGGGGGGDSEYRSLREITASHNASVVGSQVIGSVMVGVVVGVVVGVEVGVVVGVVVGVEVVVVSWWCWCC